MTRPPLTTDRLPPALPSALGPLYAGCMRRLSLALAAALLVSSVASYAGQGPAPAAVSACFTPGHESCGEFIAGRIDGAQSKVRVQAYYLTSPMILRAVVGAKRRGLDVAAILDKSQDRRTSNRSRYTGATYLANAGVPIWIDDAPVIAHNKIIILDDRTVLTGSFNFTRNADERNAENVVVLDSPEVAGWFNRNWEDRRSASRAFEPE